MPTRLIYVLILIVVSLLAFWGMWVFRKMWILDKPWKDLKGTRAPVPTMQWIIVFLSFIIIISLFFPYMWSNRLMLWFLTWWTLIVIVETITELEYIWKIKLKIPAWMRFLVHLIAACLALWISWVHDFEFILWWHVFVFPQWLLYVAFALWSTFITNAVNWIDWINAQWNWIFPYMPYNYFLFFLIVSTFT